MTIFELLSCYDNMSYQSHVPDEHCPSYHKTMYIKGTCRDHRVTGALNFHKIRDVCILVMVLDV